MTLVRTTEKPYNLDERTYSFALDVRQFLRNTKWDPVSWPDIKQVLRSSGSIAANYLEALEAISPDDYLYRIRISKKEARETGLWLKLISDSNPIDHTIHESMNDLILETEELVKIFSSIVRNKTTQNHTLT
jgi:four helix bundle protein